MLMVRGTIPVSYTSSTPSGNEGVSHPESKSLPPLRGPVITESSWESIATLVSMVGAREIADDFVRIRSGSSLSEHEEKLMV